MSKNKTILIIGAKSDIALAAAYKFASEGYSLQLAARDPSELDATVKDLKIRYKINVSAYEVDILNYETFSDIIDSLDCLPDIVLCAVGILGNQRNDENNFINSALVMKSNYIGPSLILGEIANRFEKRGYGSIIGISSVAGDRGRASNYIYGSAKSGFTAFLSGLRGRLFKSNINVVTILPGFVRTKMTSMIQLPAILTDTPKSISNLIYKNKMNANEIYPLKWRIIMLIFKCIPEFIFKRMKI